MAIQINPDAHLCILYRSVRGVKTHSEEIDTVVDGATRETRREVTETIADVHEAAAAKALRNKAGTIFGKHVSVVHNFTVSDPTRIAAFHAELGPVLELIAQHNATAKFHPVEVEFTAIPLAASLSAKAIQGIYAEITARLSTIREHFVRGDADAVTAWLKRNKSLGAFVPLAIATVVDDAVAQVKVGLTALRVAKTALAKGDDPSARPIEVVGAELAEGLFAVENALGLVATTAPVAANSAASLDNAAA